MFSQETYNPAVLGTYSEINLFGLYRLQWYGIPNAPKTFYFTLGSPLKISGDTYYLGLNFMKDDAGIFSNQNVYLQGAYKFKLYDGDLFVGANLGFVNQTVHGDSVRKIESDYHDIAGDNAIPKQSVNDMAFDLGLGALYRYKKFNANLSFLHLLEPSLQLDDYAQSYIPRMMYLSSGYQMSLPNSRYQFKPSFLFKSDFVSYQIDLSAFLERDEKYWGGLSWRYQDAVVFFVGINLSQGFNLGFSYDLSTNKIIANSAGSFELFMRYRFGIGKKKNNRYKSVRIL